MELTATVIAIRFYEYKCHQSNSSTETLLFKTYFENMRILLDLETSDSSIQRSENCNKK